MPFRTTICRLMLLLSMVTGGAAAQDGTPTPGAKPGAKPDTTQNAALRAYLDCDVMGCDREFLVTEMTWVNWMRDRLDADFHVLVTSQRTGSGGRHFTVVALGQRAFAGKADTLEFNTDPNDSEDVLRRGILRVMGQLLVPHAARGPLGSRLSISYAAPAASASGAPTAARDKWNFWTYSISGNGFLNGESRQSFTNGWTDLSANRTTEAWKIQLSASSSYNESKFTYDTLAVAGVDSSYLPVTFTTIQRNAGASALAVKSLDDHWSAGSRVTFSKSDFENTDLDQHLSAAVEWDYYPYKEFARRKLSVLYTVGLRDLNYTQVTIYGKTRETRPVHSIDATYGAKQKWGSANITLSGSQYLDGLKYYNAGIFGSVDVRLGRGLSFDMSGSLSRVRDQLALPASGLSPVEVVARQQALATNYRYFAFFGLRYQFGSIFNSVVNPRFGNLSGGGRGMMISM